MPPWAHTAMSARLSRHFNCYISSALIWAKREASAKLGTSKATSPSLTSCLSLRRSPGFGDSEKGIGEVMWSPDWNEFDGLIVAPSGHRHTSQRAGGGGGGLVQKLRSRSRGGWLLTLASSSVSALMTPCFLWFQHPVMSEWMPWIFPPHLGPFVFPVCAGSPPWRCKPAADFPLPN